MPELARFPAPDLITGCLLGGAIGDALGAPVEGWPLARIRAEHGPDGITEPVPGAFAKGSVTDATQLTMFTAQAMIAASTRERAKGIGGAATGMAQAAYLTWLVQQGESIPDQGPWLTWLTTDPEMTERRGPGATCLAALHAAAQRQWPGTPLGTPEKPVNDSKGSAGMVRAAPCGFGARNAESAFELGSRIAALTHGHPSGHLPAGVLAATVWSLLRGAEMETALSTARSELERHPSHGEASTALDAAVALDAQGPPAPERLEELGTGWTGEEALAIAVWAALGAERLEPEPFSPYPERMRPDRIGRRCLRTAVNHSGNSNSTGAVCGQLVGARYGTTAFPGYWQTVLAVRGTVIRMAADCALEFGPNPPTLPDDYGTPPPLWWLGPGHH